MRGQSGLEYLMLVGILLAALVPFIIISLQNSTSDIITSQARQAVAEVADAADRIYRLGGGKTVLDIDFPPGTTGYIVENKTVALRVKIGGTESLAVAVVDGTVIGSLSNISGTRKISVEKLSSGIIRIGDPV